MKLLPLFVSVITVMLTYFPASEAQEIRSENDSGSKAKLIIYRKKFSPPLAFKPLITINSIKAFYLPRGYHAELLLDPGDYIILADWKTGHGVADRDISISLVPGDEKVIEVASDVNFTAVALGGGIAVAGGLATESAVEEKRTIDLSKSVKITRWHAQWLGESVGGFVPEKTMQERYSLSIDNALLIDDFEKGNLQEKLSITRFLARYEIYEEEILMSFEKEILSTYKNVYEKKADLVPLVHMCKYLARSKMKEFRETIETVKNEATDKRVRKYAESYLKSYYGEQ